MREQGLTIVMVTHERSFAARASRQIVMHDGRIVADVDQRAQSAPSAQSARPAELDVGH